MSNSDCNDQNNQDSNTIRAAELAVLGEVLSTVGEVISTIAAVLALKEVLQEESNNKNMQKQIDYLTHEVKKLKQQVNNEKPRRS